MENYRNIFYEKYHSEFNVFLSSNDVNVIKSLFAHYDRKILPFLKNFPFDSKIIELGCGPGYLLDYLSLHSYKNTFGIDISKEQIELANSKGHRVKLIDVFEFFDGTSEKYDIVFAFDFFEHFTKDELIQLTTVIFNSLNPAGLLLIRTPNGQGFFPGQIIYGDLTHQTIFNPNSLKQLLIFAGFKDFIFLENSPVPKNIIGLSRLFLWKIIRTGLNIFKLIESGSRQEIWTQDFYCVAKKDAD